GGRGRIDLAREPAAALNRDNDCRISPKDRRLDRSEHCENECNRYFAHERHIYTSACRENQAAMHRSSRRAKPATTFRSIAVKGRSCVICGNSCPAQGQRWTPASVAFTQHVVRTPRAISQSMVATKLWL